jgi:hypothetical protein
LCAAVVLSETCSEKLGKQYPILSEGFLTDPEELRV